LSKFGCLWNKNACLSSLFGEFLLLLCHKSNIVIMDWLHIIAVVALVVIGVVIYINKKNG
jgi:hypothetical protein